MLGGLNRTPGSKDIWFWNGTAKGYSPKLCFSHTFASESFNPLTAWIWKSSCTMKIKVFAWMLIMDRLNTKDMVERRHWHLEDGVSCVLCPLQTRETRDHLFFNCNFSVRIWNICKLIGLLVTPWLIWSLMLAGVLGSPSSLKWCSLLAGISGSSGMLRSSGMRELDLINGDLLSSMTSA